MSDYEPNVPLDRGTSETDRRRKADLATLRERVEAYNLANTDHDLPEDLKQLVWDAVSPDVNHYLSNLRDDEAIRKVILVRTQERVAQNLRTYAVHHRPLDSWALNFATTIGGQAQNCREYCDRKHMSHEDRTQMILCRLGCRACDTVMLGHLIQCEQSLIERFARRKWFGSWTDQEDIAAEVRLRLATCRTCYNFVGLIRQSLECVIKDRWRKEGRRVQEVPLTADIAVAHGDSDDVARTAEINLDLLDLAVRISKLPVSDQEVIRYTEFEGYTDAETSKIMRQPVGTIKAIRRRAKNLLRESMVALSASAALMVLLVGLLIFSNRWDYSTPPSVAPVALRRHKLNDLCAQTHYECRSGSEFQSGRKQVLFTGASAQ